MINAALRRLLIASSWIKVIPSSFEVLKEFWLLPSKGYISYSPPKVPKGWIHFTSGEKVNYDKDNKYITQQGKFDFSWDNLNKLDRGKFIKPSSKLMRSGKAPGGVDDDSNFSKMRQKHQTWSPHFKRIR